MLFISVILFVVGLSCFTKLRVEPHAIRYFPQTHWLRQDYDQLENSGFGLASLELVFSVDKEFWNKRSGRVGALTSMDQFLDECVKNEHVVGRLDPTLFLREASFQSSQVDSIPANAVLDEVFEETDFFASAFFSADKNLFRATLFLKTIDADQIDAVRAHIEKCQQDLNLKATVSSKLKLTPTGSYPLLLQTQRSLLETLKSSLLATAALMLCVMFIVLRSVKLTLLSVLPNAFPVAMNFLLMVSLDIPLDVGTTMTTAIALGIAVDDTIHFLSAWKSGGIEGAKAATGKAILLSSVIIGSGFATLLISDFIPTKYFGLLCMSAMFSALVGDLLILPPILSLFANESEEAAAKGTTDLNSDAHDNGSQTTES